jgi:hypothetical protein
MRERANIPRNCLKVTARTRLFPLLILFFFPPFFFFSFFIIPSPALAGVINLSRRKRITRDANWPETDRDRAREGRVCVRV